MAADNGNLASRNPDGLLALVAEVVDEVDDGRRERRSLG